MVLLPGPPRELAPMYETSVEPRLRGKVKAAMGTRILRVHGLGESMVQEKCEAELRAMGLGEIGYCARPGEVDLRMKSTDGALLERAVVRVRSEVVMRGGV